MRKILITLSVLFLSIPGLLFPGLLVAQDPPTYSVSGLGDLPDGASDSFTHGINNSGHVVGSFLSDRERPFVWDTSLRELPTPSDSGGRAQAISDSGKIVGVSYNEFGYPRAFLWDGSLTRDLGTLSSRGGVSVAFAVNDNGQVVGYSDLDEDGYVMHAFMWQNGIMRDLGTLEGGFHSWANDINPRGQVTGTSNSGEYNIQRAFRWENGVMQNLGTLPGGGESNGYGINVNGDVVGSARPDPSLATFLPQHAVLWLNGSPAQDLGTLPGMIYSVAYHINAHRQIVGLSDTAESWTTPHAVLWQDGAMYDLNDLIPPNSGWELKSANRINELGQIVGVGNYNAVTRGFLLSPNQSACHFFQKFYQRFFLFLPPLFSCHSPLFLLSLPWWGKRLQSERAIHNLIIKSQATKQNSTLGP